MHYKVDNKLNQPAYSSKTLRIYNKRANGFSQGKWLKRELGKGVGEAVLNWSLSDTNKSAQTIVVSSFDPSCITVYHDHRHTSW